MNRIQHVKATLRFLWSLALSLVIAAIFLTEYGEQLITAAVVVVFAAIIWAFAETVYYVTVVTPKGENDE